MRCLWFHFSCPLQLIHALPADDDDDDDDDDNDDNK